jgi:hemolysin activation/secretion protein
LPDVQLFTPISPEPTAPPTLDETAPGEPDPNQALCERLTLIRFENFSPPPPGSSQTAKSKKRRRSAVPAASSQQTLSGGSIENQVRALSKALSNPTSELSTTARNALDGTFTLLKFDALIASVTAAARADGGWSLAQAFAPDQELTEGVLRIVVAPVWLESVEIKGAGWTNPKTLQKPFNPLIGDPINLADMSRAQFTINKHPFRSLSAAMTPGQTPGSSKAELTIKESKPWTVFSGYETTHSRDSGIGRAYAGFNMAPPWRREDIWTMHSSTDSGAAAMALSPTGRPRNCVADRLRRHSMPISISCVQPRAAGSGNV